MSRTGWATRAIAMLLAVGLPFLGGLVASTRAQTAPDKSEVVLVLDFSASILVDKTNRNRFAAALERIADRIDLISADLVAGDTTVSIVQFATRAMDRAGCVDLKLVGSPEQVAHFADCLRGVAAAYRKGLDATLRRRIGVDTNYVAAMQRAAVHLPADAVRPAVILLTDGKHDVKGVPVSRVRPTRDKLFGSRPTFALLPVGMGLQPSERGALSRGLESLRVIRAMPACVSGAVFEWPQVVFRSADQAGDAVALALQDVTCTFTVAPTPTPVPSPTPTPVPPPGAVRSIGLVAGDGRIDISWGPPATPASPIVDYQARCRTGGGDWILSQEGVSLATSTVIEGLTNGATYECQVTAIDARSLGTWTAAGGTVAPIGRPSAPAKPAVAPMDRAVRIQVPAMDPSQVTTQRFECSPDQGATWPARVDVSASTVTATDVRDLTNGSEYVCRAFSLNASGISDASAISDAVRPCGSLLDCNPVISIALSVVGLGLIAGILVAILLLYRGRTRGYVIAVVDVIHTANLGHGSTLGIKFLRPSARDPITSIVPDRTPKADLRIQFRKGNFVVTDSVGRHVAMSGQRILVTDAAGLRHEVVLTAFATQTAANARLNA